MRPRGMSTRDGDPTDRPGPPPAEEGARGRAAGVRAGRPPPVPDGVVGGRPIDSLIYVVVGERDVSDLDQPTVSYGVRVYFSRAAADDHARRAEELSARAQAYAPPPVLSLREHLALVHAEARGLHDLDPQWQRGTTATRYHVEQLALDRESTQDQQNDPRPSSGRTTVDFEAFSEMRAARDAEAATADRTARLYDGVLRWALGVEAEAARAGVPLRDHLAQGPGSQHALWLAVAAHREEYPASAGPAAVREHAASARLPSLRPWAPVGEVSLRLGSAAEALAQLADLPDDRVSDGFLAKPVARVEALAYRDAARVGLIALRGDGRVYRRTYRVLEDLAVARRVHDPELRRAADVLLDQLAHRLVEDLPGESLDATGED